ncbi:hypothetical protein ABKN59_005824 [Abortiporus biennis]
MHTRDVSLCLTDLGSTEITPFSRYCILQSRESYARQHASFKLQASRIGITHSHTILRRCHNAYTHLRLFPQTLVYPSSNTLIIGFGFISEYP